MANTTKAIPQKEEARDKGPETSDAPLPLLDISQAVQELASAILQSGAIPAKAARDAAHIAISAVHGIDFLLTWNCAHMLRSDVADEWAVRQSFAAVLMPFFASASALVYCEFPSFSTWWR